MSTTDTDCTCATDRDAHRCPMHSQADYDAQQTPAPDAARDERLREARARAGLIRSTHHNGDHLRPGALDDLTVLVLDEEITRLDAVVTAVREVHVPRWVPNHDGDSDLVCSCGHIAADEDDPCPTVRALDGGAS